MILYRRPKVTRLFQIRITFLESIFSNLLFQIIRIYFLKINYEEIHDWATHALSNFIYKINWNEKCILSAKSTETKNQKPKTVKTSPGLRWWLEFVFHWGIETDRSQKFSRILSHPVPCWNILSSNTLLWYSKFYLAYY